MYDESLAGICCECNEKLRGVQEFYEIILNAQKQVQEIKVEVKESEDCPKIRSPKKRRKVSRQLPDSIKSDLDVIEPKEKTSLSIERREQMALEDVKLSQFFTFFCKDCPSITFRNFATYIRHMKKFHKIPRPFITCCKQRYAKRWRLLEHMSYHLNPDDFKCPECLRQFTAKDRIDKHCQQMHGPKEDLTHECDKCGRRFRALAGLKTHLLSHLSKEEKDTLRVHICNECGSKFITKFLLVQHMKLVHIQANPYVCDICAKIYKSKAQFLYHHKTSHQESREPKVQCKICKRLCLNEHRLKTHMRRVHADDGPHICDICQKEAPSSRALKSHKLYVHESLRKFLCTFCEKAFKKEVELKEHLTVHLGGALYSCPFCEKTFNSKANMYSHRKRTHAEENEELQKKKRGHL